MIKNWSQRNSINIIDYIGLLKCYRTEQDLIFMRNVFISEFSRKFNSNILRIALNLTEDRVAAYIVARLPVYIDEGVMNYAV